jgi:hypothetical protein
MKPSRLSILTTTLLVVACYGSYDQGHTRGYATGYAVNEAEMDDLVLRAGKGYTKVKQYADDRIAKYEADIKAALENNAQGYQITIERPDEEGNTVHFIHAMQTPEGKPKSPVEMTCFSKYMMDERNRDVLHNVGSYKNYNH